MGEPKKKEILQNEFGIQMTQTMARKVSGMCNLSESVWNHGKAEGLSIGKAEGISIGKTEGINIGKSEDIRNLMETMNLSMEQAMAALKISKTDQAAYIRLLKQ